MRRKCPKCGSIEESKFCTNCGQSLIDAAIVRICPNCGAETTSRFCVQCGTKIEQTDEEKIIELQKDADKEAEKQKEEEKQRLAKQKEEEEKQRLAKQKEEEEKQRLAKQKEEEKKQRLAKQKEEEEKQRLVKQKEEEEKQRLAKQKEEEEKQRLAKQKEEEEKQRLAKQKEEEEKQRLAKQKEEEERRKKEQIRSNLRDKKKYEEALSYMEHAEQVSEKAVAAELFRRAENLFEELVGWEDAEEKSLICARKAKACEISIESEKIADNKAKGIETVNVETGSADKNEKKSLKSEEVASKVPASTNKSKSKAIIAAVIIGVLVIGGAIFAMTQGKTGNQESGSADDSNNSVSEGEAFQGDLIAVEDGLKIEWDNGSAVLTNYQLEKSEYDGDCVNLYFDYSKTGGDDDSFNGALDVGVFQNGYELDEKSSLTTEAEDNAYNQVKSGANITAARGFMLNDSSELTVVLTAYDKDYNKIVERTKLSIPSDKAKEITGNKKYFEETGETAIKDGISIKSSTGEAKLTGYKWTEYDGQEMLIVYFDFTNLSDEEQALNGSDFNFTVFQNGVEQEGSGWSTSEAESHYFSQVQKGTTMHCGYSYSIPEKTEIEVKLTCWSDDTEKTEEQVVKVK